MEDKNKNNILCSSRMVYHATLRDYLQGSEALFMAKSPSKALAIPQAQLMAILYSDV